MCRGDMPNTGVDRHEPLAGKNQNDPEGHQLPGLAAGGGCHPRIKLVIAKARSAEQLGRALPSPSSVQLAPRRRVSTETRRLPGMNEGKMLQRPTVDLDVV